MVHTIRCLVTFFVRRCHPGDSVVVRINDAWTLTGHGGQHQPGRGRGVTFYAQLNNHHQRLTQPAGRCVVVTSAHRGVLRVKNITFYQGGKQRTGNCFLIF
jgi:hypothetical protein